MIDFANKPNHIPWPPLILLACIFGGFALGRILPLPWFNEPMASWLTIAGYGLAVIALAIDLAAMWTMHKAKTTILPNRGSENLVDHGIFARSRNPIYVANVMLICAIALITGQAWLFATAMLDAFLTTQLAIKREEAHLTARFGDRYREYCARVKRWL